LRHLGYSKSTVLHLKVTRLLC